jgi:hypothetical protein
MRLFLLIFSLCLVGCDNSRHGAILTIGPDSTPRDYTVGQSPICEVHHIQMQRTSVRVVYGLPGSSALAEARYEASKKAFPHAETSVSGGCVVAPGISATNAFIYTCPECKKAASRWDSDYGKR